MKDDTKNTQNTENIKNYKILELDKILEKLSFEATSEEGKIKSLEILPYNSFDETKKSLQQTYDAYTLIGNYGTPSFSSVRDVKYSLKLAKAGAVLSVKDLLKISSTLSAFSSILNWKTHSNENKTSLDKYFSKIYVNKYLEDKLNSALISEDEIADSASKELFSIRKKIKLYSERARERLISMTHNKSYAKYLQEPIVTIRNDRFVIPVKGEYKSHIPGLVHDSSASGATLFIEPMTVVEANNQINELKSKERIEIDKILKDLSAEVGNFSDLIYNSHEAAIYLDVIFSKANLAYKMNASLPKINNDGKIILKKARHPLIAANKVVPIDISLGETYNTLVITGPNTGGKTVTLKTIALLVLMTMCGLMIPVDDKSEISVFDNIFIDVGDEQSIEQSLSTFSAHMKNIVNILNSANEKSLVLLDELGAGTDPVEGAALAIAILEKLLQNKSKVVATTHYAELKIYAIQSEGVENASCEFDINNLSPTYKILIGIPGKSNAFLISKRLGLSNEIISKAKTHLSKNNANFEQVVAALNKSKLELDKKQDEYVKLLSDLNKEKHMLSENIKKLESKNQEILESDRKKAREIAEKAILKSEILLSELESLKKSQKSATTTMREKHNNILEELHEFVDPVKKSQDQPNKKIKKISIENIKIGDILNLTSCNKLGKVVGFSGKNEVILQLGLIKTNVNVNDLSYASNKDIKKSQNKLFAGNHYSSTRNMSSTSISTEIDVRGLDSSEAIHLVDKFIDSAILHNIKNVTIIHGKGKGILRKELQKYLKKQKYVKSQRLGSLGEGDTGVTIVEL